MKTENCCYKDCANKAEVYCGNFKHEKYGRVLAGWCNVHHPDNVDINKYMDINQSWIPEMGLLRYGKKFNPAPDETNSI